MQSSKLDITTVNDPSRIGDWTRQPPPRHGWLLNSASALIFILLTLAALIPRLILAHQLDVVTDEVIYIFGGKIYLSLLTHLPSSIDAPGWIYNNEHPPLVKILIGLAIHLNQTWGHPMGELQAARLPSVLMSTLLVVAVYGLGRKPFGHLVALCAAFCLAFSPWLVYFSALAYLDTTMMVLISIAYLLLWHALYRPWLYLLSAILLGLGVDSKYPAIFILPGMLLFISYYFVAIRPRLPVEMRTPIPWRWWLGSLLLAPLTFFITDPAIWNDPFHRLLNSFNYEWNHSLNGHLTFMAGAHNEHMPHWTIFYIVANKLSIFVTIPALLFLLISVIQLIRFHRHTSTVHHSDALNYSFLTIWLLSTILMFSLFNIVVGTHYDLPVAPPIVLTGTMGLSLLIRYRTGRAQRSIHTEYKPANKYRWHTKKIGTIDLKTGLQIIIIAIAIVVPHLWGLISIPMAEGYTSEIIRGENTTLQVAYPAYRNALAWIAEHNHNKHAKIGLVALPNTLKSKGNNISWYLYNKDMVAQFQLSEVHPKDRHFSGDYLVWPMHLVQRGYTIPEPWRDHIIHTVTGGDTIYCYIVARTI